MSTQQRGINESTIARIAGNLMSGLVYDDQQRQEAVRRAVIQAREIVAEVERTAPAPAQETERGR